MGHRRSPRLSADARRADIVATASELFAAKGFTGTTTKSIADACGVSEATIFRHFETKEELYDAIILTHMQTENDMGVTEELKEAGDDRAFFLTFAVNYLRFMENNQVFWRLLWRSALEDRELSTRFLQEHVHDRMMRLTQHIARRQEAGALRGLDPMLAATTFVGMLAHHVNLKHVFKGPFLQDVSSEEVAAFIVDVYLEGVRKS